MRPSKIKPLWVIAATATVAGALLAGCQSGSDQESSSHEEQSVPQASGKKPDTPDEAPEYDVDDCEYEPLREDGDPPTEGESVPEVISPSGEYRVGVDTLSDPMWGPDGKEKGSLDKKVEKELGDFDGADAAAVNSRGVVVGESYTKKGKSEHNVAGWVYYDGKAAELTIPDGLDLPEETEVHPTDINEDGEVSGFVKGEGDENNRSVIRQFPLKWEAGKQKAKALDSDEDGANADAITEDGSVVGADYVGDTPHDGDIENDVGDMWKWDAEGKREKLPIPGGEAQVAGDWLLSQGTEEAGHRWNMADEGDPEEVELTNAIDSRGRTFGVSDDGAAVESESGVEQLPTSKDDPDHAEHMANAVSANSGIIGGHYSTGEDEETKVTAVQWDCTDS